MPVYFLFVLSGTRIEIGLILKGLQHREFFFTPLFNPTNPIHFLSIKYDKNFIFWFHVINYFAKFWSRDRVC